MNGNGSFAMRRQKDALSEAKNTMAGLGSSVTGKPYSYGIGSKPAFGKEFKVERLAIDYKVGDTVRHVKFGTGVVTELVSGGKDYEVTVDFEKVGVKRMFASFAKLKKIDV